MLVGGGLAVVVARCRFPLAGIVSALPLVTLVVPDVVVAAAWVLILGRQGLVNMALAPWGIELPSLYSWWGMVYVMTLNNYVYAFVAVMVGLKSMDGNLEEAALSLGRPIGRVLGGVTLPLLLPSLFAGALIVFTHVIGSFGVPAILGARTPGAGGEEPTTSSSARWAATRRCRPRWRRCWCCWARACCWSRNW